MTAYRAALCVGAAVSAAWVLGSTPAHAAPWTPGPVPNIQHKVALQPGPVPYADDVFLGLLSQIPGLTVTDPGVTEAGGRHICAFLTAGHSREDATSAALDDNHTLTPAEAAALIEAAADAYCPSHAAQSIS